MNQICNREKTINFIIISINEDNYMCVCVCVCVCERERERKRLAVMINEAFKLISIKDRVFM